MKPKRGRPTREITGEEKGTLFLEDGCGNKMDTQNSRGPAPGFRGGGGILKSLSQREKKKDWPKKPRKKGMFSKEICWTIYGEKTEPCLRGGNGGGEGIRENLRGKNARKNDAPTRKPRTPAKRGPRRGRWKRGWKPFQEGRAPCRKIEVP